MTMESMVQAPLIFTPILKSVLWGGDKICRYKDIPADGLEKIGESWEISAVPGHESVVAEGPYAGCTLNELVRRFGAQLLGSEVERHFGGEFPLLIKFIDAARDLSVQVHPNDALARKRHGSLGKTEMWYIIDADKDALIYSGLRRSITPEEYERRVADNSFAELLAAHDSAPGDVFFLPAGRIHAIGAGNLLAEIQESSDVTYRIYDYGRRDAEGNLRELHTELAKEAIDFEARADYKSAPLPVGQAECEVVTCDHFTVGRMLVDGSAPLTILGPDSFTVLMCIEGSVKVDYAGGMLELRRGHTLLFPACLASVSLTGHATLLTARS